MPHHPQPHHFNGSKEWLANHRDHPNARIAAIAHMGTYLGNVLEHILFELQRQGFGRQAPPWFPDTQEEIPEGS